MQLLEFFIDISVRTAGAVSGMMQVQTTANATTGSLNRTGMSAGKLTKRFLGAAGGAFSLYKIGQQLGRGMIDVENGMIGVAKTTGLAGVELKNLKSGYRALAADTAVNSTIAELFELGEVAGTAGIKGVDNILKFSEVMAKLNSASGGKLQGEAGAKAVLNILDAAGDGVDTIDQLASSITQMGNDFRVNEAEIAATATRVANSLRSYGAGASDIVGLSTAFAELRLSPELAQTAISKTLSKMSLAVAEGGKELESFKRITGLSRKEIEHLLKTDGAALFTKFAGGLNKAKNEGKDLTVVLKEVGLADQRTGDSLKAIGSNAERLNTIMASSRSAYEKNTALNEEAAAAGESFSGEMKKLGNSIGFLGDAIASTGLLDALKSLMSLISDGIFIITYLISVLDPVATALAILPAVLWLLIPPLMTAIAATWAWTTALLANPVVWIFAAIAAAIYAVVWTFRNFGKIVDWFQEKWAKFGKYLLLNPMFWLPYLVFKAIKGVFNALGGLDGIKQKFSSFFGFLKTAFMNSPFGLLVRLARWSTNKVLGAVEKLGGIKNILDAAFAPFRWLIKNNPIALLGRALEGGIPAVSKALAKLYGQFKEWLMGKLGAVVDWAKGKVEAIKNWFGKKWRQTKELVGLKSDTGNSGDGPVNFGGRGSPPPPGAAPFIPANSGRSVIQQDNSLTVDRIEINALPGMSTEDLGDEFDRRLQRYDRRVAIDATN